MPLTITVRRTSAPSTALNEAGSRVMIGAANTLRVAGALRTGAHLVEGLRRLAGKHEMIGDVRGTGLAIGAEIVSDRSGKTPDRALASRIVNAMRDNGVLIGANGIHSNVLKIRPPMSFGVAEADLLLDTLDLAVSAV